MRAQVPDGAYYVLAEAAGVSWRDSRERARGLLAKTGVAAVAGSAFFSTPAAGEDLLRFCFAKKDEELTEACRRLRALGNGERCRRSLK